jgi:hypothetical protein
MAAMWPTRNPVDQLAAATMLAPPKVFQGGLVLESRLSDMKTITPPRLRRLLPGLTLVIALVGLAAAQSQMRE